MELRGRGHITYFSNMTKGMHRRSDKGLKLFVQIRMIQHPMNLNIKIHPYLPLSNIHIPDEDFPGAERSRVNF